MILNCIMENLYNKMVFINRKNQINRTEFRNFLKIGIKFVAKSWILDREKIVSNSTELEPVERTRSKI
jgi:hypothetical protein